MLATGSKGAEFHRVALWVVLNQRHVTRSDLQRANMTQWCPVSTSDGVSVRFPQLGQAGFGSLTGGRSFLVAPAGCYPRHEGRQLQNC